MKKISVFLGIIFIFSACTSTKELTDNRKDNRKLRKLAEQVEIKKAVESRKYIIKVDKLYTTRGEIIHTYPQNNFIIVNGEIASISLGYLGRSFSRPISGINLNARTSYYKMESDDTRGNYKIQMSVKYGSDKFDVYMTIGKEGSCSISLNNSYIQSINYSGTLEPIPGSGKIPADKGDRM